MWELDYKEIWAPKNWCFWNVLEKILESPLDCKNIKPLNPKENQSWIFIGKSDAEAETLIIWPLDAKNWFSWKDPDAGKDWRQEEKETTEGEVVGWHHWLNGHEFQSTLGVGVEKEMATHSSILVWRIPGMEEPGGLLSMGLHRVRHDWCDLACMMHWRRKWQPTPVFLPGESQGQGSLVGCRLWGRTELDTT